MKRKLYIFAAASFILCCSPKNTPQVSKSETVAETTKPKDTVAIIAPVIQDTTTSLPVMPSSDTFSIFGNWVIQLYGKVNDGIFTRYGFVDVPIILKIDENTVTQRKADSTRVYNYTRKDKLLSLYNQNGEIENLVSVEKIYRDSIIIISQYNTDKVGLFLLRK